MFKPRTIQEIQIGLFKTLAEQGSGLTDIAPGSLNYTLMRSLAIIHSEQDLVLQEVASAAYLSTAVGSDLDALGANYGLSRKAGGYAVGYVLALSNKDDTELPPKTVLTDTTTGLQYYLNTDYPVTVRTFVENQIKVVATRAGKEYNTATGSRLINSGFPNLIFTVASHRTTAGQTCGDITGGETAERDDTFRGRITDFILNSRAGTQTAIKAALMSDPIVSWVSFNTPLPGYLEIWVDCSTAITAQEFARLNSRVLAVAPAGITTSLNQVTRQYVDINVYVQTYNNQDLTALTDLLLGRIESYLFTLEQGGTLTIAGLTQVVRETPGVLIGRVIAPSADVLATPNSVIRSNNIWITHDAL